MELIPTQLPQQNNDYKKQLTDDFASSSAFITMLSLHPSCVKAKNVSL